MPRFSQISRRRRRGTPFLVLQIHHKSLSYAVLQQTGTDSLNVLSFGVKPINTVSFEATLDETYSELHKEFHMNRAIFGLPGSTLRARIGTYSSRRDHPKTFMKEQESNAIENKALADAAKEMQESLSAESGILPEDLEVQSLQILQTTIDGYGVPALKGFSGKTIEFGVFGAFLLRPHTYTLQAFARKYGMRMFSVAHAAQAIAHSSRNADSDGIYLLMEEEMTQIIVKKNGVLSFIDTIPMGGNAFTEALEKNLGMPENVAKEFQTRYFQGYLSEELQGRVRTLLLPEVQDFATLVKRRLESMRTSFPSAVWFFGEGSQIQELRGIFDERMSQDVAFLGTPKAAFLSPNDIWNIQNFAWGSNPRHTPLFLLAYSHNELPLSLQ